jgi:hypothetical protein
MSITFEILEKVNRELPDSLLFAEDSISSCAASGNGFGMKGSDVNSPEMAG